VNVDHPVEFSGKVLTQALAFGVPPSIAFLRDQPRLVRSGVVE